MIDNGIHNDDDSYVRKGDKCALNPAFCEDGLSFSIWEKFSYDPKVMEEFQEHAENFPRKYIVTSGADFDEETAKSCPGFAIFRQVQIRWMLSYIWNIFPLNMLTPFWYHF